MRREGRDLVIITIRVNVPGQVGAKVILTDKGHITGNLGGGNDPAEIAISIAAQLLSQR